MVFVLDVLKISFLFSFLFLLNCNLKETDEILFVANYRINPEYLNTIYTKKLEAHGRFVDSLHSEGVLLKAGPLNDSIGLAIYKHKNLKELKALLMKDPAVVEQLLLFELTNWDLQLK